MKARTALLIYLAAKRKPGPQRGDLVWSSSQAEYYYEGTGRPVSGRDLRSAWDHYIVSVRRDLEKQTDRMLANRISVAEYQQILRDHAKDMGRIGYMTGRGGRFAMTGADWLAAGREVNRQNHYIDRFTRQLAAGQAGTEGQIRTRANMYGQAGYGMVEAGQRAAKEEAGYTEERRNAVMDQNTCSGCADYHRMGWRPIGTLPLPGEGTPCAGNCRCEMEYRGNPIPPSAEAQYIADKLRQDWAAEGEAGITYDINTGEEPAEGFALSVYPEREKVIPIDKVQYGDIQDYIEQNADLLTDVSKWPHRLGGWVDDKTHELFLDVSIVIPPDQLERAATAVLEYNQRAMWSLGDGEEIRRDRCIELLKEAGKLPADYEDPMGKAMKAKPRRQAVFFTEPKLAGMKDPATGQRVSFAQQMSDIITLGRYLRDKGGAAGLTDRAGLEHVIKQYRAHEEHDIADFFALMPEMKPADWAEKKDEYMRGDPRRWEALAWV